MSSGFASPMPPAASHRHDARLWSTITEQQRQVTLLVEEDAHGKVVRSRDINHVGLFVINVRLAGVFVFNCQRRRRRQDHRQQVT